MALDIPDCLVSQKGRHRASFTCERDFLSFAGNPVVQLLTIPTNPCTHTYVISDYMFCAGAVAFAKLLRRSVTATPKTSDAYMPEATGTGDTQEVSSVQRESSGSDSILSLRERPSVKSLVTNSSFSESEAMSDRVTIDQQRREEQNAMILVRDNSPVSEELLGTGQWIQDTRGGLTTSLQTGGFWPNSNNTAVDATPQREGCSRASDEGSSPGS